MELKISDILEIPSLKRVKVIAGENGLEKNISSVIYGEIPDYKNIIGNEIVFTTGWLFKDKQEEIVSIISSLNDKGASALVIELGRFIETVPQNAIELANQLNFPILNVPEVLGVEFVHTVQSEIINRQTKKLEFSEKTLKLFTSKMALGENIKSLLKHLSQVLSKEIYYFNKYFNTSIHIGADGTELTETNEKNIIKLLIDKKNFPIEVQHKKYGHIIFPSEHKNTHLTDYEHIAIEHAITVIKLQIQKKISNRQIESNYRNEFIQELITDNALKIEDMERRGSLYGWDLTSGRRVVIIQIDHLDNYNDAENVISIKEDIIYEVKNHFYKNFQSMIFGNFSDYIVLLLEEISNQEKESISVLKILCNDLRKLVKNNYNYTISVGIGKYNNNIKEAYQSYTQAKKAIELGRTIYGNNHTTYYGELGLFNVLEPIYQKQEARNFCKEQLGSILNYDKAHDTKLFESIKVLSQEDWNLKNSSKKLYIHYNTMKYRLNKICELLGLSSINSETKLNIGVALKIIEMDK